VWKKFKDAITIEDLREMTHVSLLYRLSFINDKVFNFNQIWHQFKTQLTMADLCAVSETHPTSSAFCVLLVLSLDKPIDIPFLTELFTQIPGAIPETQLIAFKNRIEQAIHLINAQNKQKVVLTAFSTLFPAFASKLANAKKEANVSDSTLNALFEMAQHAQNAGYLNPFYEIGTWLLPLNRDKALEAFAKVPPQSWHFQKVNLLLAEEYFSIATQTVDAVKKQDYLKLSLHSFFNTAPDNQTVVTKKAFIQKIAVCALSQENETAEKNLPVFLTSLMNEELTAEAWFVCFEKIIQDRKHQSEQIQSQNELFAQLSAMQSELASLRQMTQSLKSKVDGKAQAPVPALTFRSKEETSKVPNTSQAVDSAQAESVPQMTR
jgi:hypothetical protein